MPSKKCSNPHCKCVKCKCGANCQCGSNYTPRPSPNGNHQDTTNPCQMRTTCPLDDNAAQQILAVWKQVFPDTTILPSNSSGVVTITHTLGQRMSINGLQSKSPLANNAWYSVEYVNGKFLNLYEIMIPGVPGVNGPGSSASSSLSSSELYVKTLAANGLNVAGVGVNWLGATMLPKDRSVTAVHHQSASMTPLEFSRATINAIETLLRYLKHRPAV